MKSNGRDTSGLDAGICFAGAFMVLMWTAIIFLLLIKLG